MQRSQGALSSRYDYDPMGRLTRHQASLGALSVQRGHAVLERRYAYDAASQLRQRQDSLRGAQNFEYDPTGRILAALPTASNTAFAPERFVFDPASNILSPPSSDESAAPQASRPRQWVPDNRLRFYQDLHFEYDPHGNLTRRIQGNQSRQQHSETRLSWDAAHQLTSAQVNRHGVTQTTHYRYDALGRRISKADAFGSTHYLWDGDLMVQSQRANQQAVLFIYEPNSFVPLATVQHGQTFWYQCDQIGAPLELTDALGRIAWAADYKVWGEARVWAGSKTGMDGWAVSQSPIPALEQPFRFQGQQFDAETGLHYNRFRYYDPVVGRFVSQDPIGLNGGANLFLYASNSVEWVDPLGLTANRKPVTGKPNIDNRGKKKCDCKKWEIKRYDRTCEGHVPGVGYAKYFHDPTNDLWYSSDKTGHGSSSFKIFSSAGGSLGS